MNQLLASDIHHYDQRLAAALTNLENDKNVLDVNRRKVKQFIEYIRAEGLSTPRQVRYTYVLRKLSGLLGKEFRRTTKTDMIRVISDLEKQETAYDTKLSESDITPITAPAFTSPQVPPESKEEHSSTQKSVSGNLSQPPQTPQSPPLGLAEVADPGTNNQLNTLTTPPSEGTRDKPETPDEASTNQNSGSTQQNTVQKPPGACSQQDLTGNQNTTDQGRFPAIDQLQLTNQTGLPLVPSDGKTPSDPHTSHMEAPPAPPPPPKVEDKKSNEAPNDQSNVQGIIVNPEDTSLKSQPSMNHNLRNKALIFAAVVGVGAVALYALKPEVRQWVSSQYTRIFHKASPQSASDGTFTQLQQNSNASTQSYARVNDPNGVPVF